MRLPNVVRLPAGVLLLLVLSGCTPTGNTLLAESGSGAGGIYASEEEALAAAEEAYAEYSRVVLDSSREDASDPSAVEAVASGSHLDELLSEFNARVADGRYVLGERSFDQFELARYSGGDSLTDVVAVYLCDDLSGLATYHDGSAVDSDIPAAPTRFTVVFDFDPNAQSLVVSSRELWSSDPC